MSPCDAANISLFFSRSMYAVFSSDIADVCCSACLLITLDTPLFIHHDAFRYFTPLHEPFSPCHYAAAG